MGVHAIPASVLVLAVASTIGGTAVAVSVHTRAAGDRARVTIHTAERVATSACAADDMVLVSGSYCTEVAQTCLRWLDKEQLRCAEFAPSQCTGTRKPLRVCVDKFEYPNKPGEKPKVQVDFFGARAACAAEGKRLCSEDEWTFACEGPRALPYPYGTRRNPNACNIDKELPTPDDASHTHWKSPVDQREASGTRSCSSPFGVHDLTGNVDEWVVANPGQGRTGALKGGYWGPVRNRCRASTLAHDEHFAFYQIGFRCCRDAPPPAHAK